MSMIVTPYAENAHSPTDAEIEELALTLTELTPNLPEAGRARALRFDFGSEEAIVIFSCLVAYRENVGRSVEEAHVFWRKNPFTNKGKQAHKAFKDYERRLRCLDYLSDLFNVQLEDQLEDVRPPEPDAEPSAEPDESNETDQPQPDQPTTNATDDTDQQPEPSAGA